MDIDKAYVELRSHEKGNYRGGSQFFQGSFLLVLLFIEEDEIYKFLGKVNCLRPRAFASLDDQLIWAVFLEAVADP